MSRVFALACPCGSGALVARLARTRLSPYSELVSPSDLPAVSGAMKIDSTNPKITRPAATSMVGPMPNAAMKIGVPYVATIVPTREMPMAKPTAVALTSVGNSSLG